jgi:hypothetical protein
MPSSLISRLAEALASLFRAAPPDEALRPVPIRITVSGERRHPGNSQRLFRGGSRRHADGPH